ncbi:MAG: tRNA (adenosine(37)-N6)-threonylcarbamoyltransferase complex ATPase subunit type 1 TsaE [Steroidobacteraceae bacterium]
MSGVFNPRHWQLADAAHTRIAGQALGRALMLLNETTPTLITLQGDLGAGKTTLVSGLLHALGHVGSVPSPTYTLIEPYELANRSVYHLDLYRLTDPLQLEELGWRDLLQSRAILLVEWPEQAGTNLPTADLSIQLSYPDNGSAGRQLGLCVSTESLQQLVDRLVI